MPEALQRKHNTRWEPGEDYSLKGQLRFIELTEGGRNREPPLWKAGAENPMAEPQAW